MKTRPTPLESSLAPRLRRCLALLRGIAAAALLLHCLFAHGCHGDEDHELFTHVASPSAP